MPASAKMGFMKQFIPVLANIVSEGYAGLELEEGEQDFCTALFEDNRGQPGSRLLAQVCTMDKTGKIVRSKIKIYDLAALVGGLNLDAAEEADHETSNESPKQIEE